MTTPVTPSAGPTPSSPPAPPGAPTPHDRRTRADIVQPVVAGVVSGLVGWLGSFAVFLAGLRAVGASAEQAASGLFVTSLLMGLGCVVFSWRTRMPVTMAWSTPGAAFLAASAAPATGFGGAVAVFLACGLAYAACGAVPALERAVERIPAPLASAMLAGVLLTLCVAPFRGMGTHLLLHGVVVAVWLCVFVVARRWAVVAAVVAAVAVAVTTGSGGAPGPAAVPTVTLTAATFDPRALLALALPLFLITMTSQNIAGVAVMRSLGFPLGLRSALLYTGAATAVGAPAGGSGVNLAAIAAALAAGPEAHPQPARRWVAGVACGVTYIAFGLSAGVVVALVAHAPDGLVATVTGLALLPTLAAAAGAALADPAHREACALTVVVAASGVTLAGIGGAFWGLVAGGVLWWATGRWGTGRRSRSAVARSATDQTETSVAR